MLLRSETQSLESSPVLSESRRTGLRWTDAESEIRNLHCGALGELTEQQSRRLYSLELAASRHAGASPGALVQRAERVLQ